MVETGVGGNGNRRREEWLQTKGKNIRSFFKDRGVSLVFRGKKERISDGNNLSVRKLFFSFFLRKKAN